MKDGLLIEGFDGGDDVTFCMIAIGEEFPKKDAHSNKINISKMNCFFDKFLPPKNRNQIILLS